MSYARNRRLRLTILDSRRNTLHRLSKSLPYDIRSHGATHGAPNEVCYDSNTGEFRALAVVDVLFMTND